MRVTFPRLPDHEPAYAVVERDDGVVYRLYGGRSGSALHGSALPHDIRHLVVERSLGIREGIWAGIASGVVFGSMRCVSGRHPRATRRLTGHLPLLADLVERVAGLDDPSDAQVRALARSMLSTLPPEETDIDPAAVVAAARALRVEAARWARLRVGESLSYDWPVPHSGDGGRRAG
jgi:hypothetical protein